VPELVQLLAKKIHTYKISLNRFQKLLPSGPASLVSSGGFLVAYHTSHKTFKKIHQIKSFCFEELLNTIYLNNKTIQINQPEKKKMKIRRTMTSRKAWKHRAHRSIQVNPVRMKN
jgi:hypothetical protein